LDRSEGLCALGDELGPNMKHMASIMLTFMRRSRRRKDIQDLIEALLAVFQVLGITASRLVSCSFAADVQCNRQNSLILSRMAANLSESPRETTKAEHDIQRFRLFTMFP